VTASISLHTLPAVFVHAVLEKAASCGAAREPLVEASGLSPAQLASPENPVPVAAVFATWEAAMRTLRDPGFPIAYARGFTIEHYPILGFAVMTAQSGREAFERVLRFGSIVTTSGRWSIRDEEESFAFVWDRPGERTLGHRVANEAVLAEVIASVRQMFGVDIRATAVRFRHPAPSNTKAHDAYFGARVTWQRDEDAVVLPRSVLSASPRFANLAMASYFEKEAAQRLKVTRDAETLRDTVARIVAERLIDGEPPLEAIAKQLGKTERTLRRSLAEEGISYRLIVDDVRRRRADELLSDQAVSIAEVAFALGFSENSPFTRAYKRWTGTTPMERRRADARPKPA
jgi:AraC-like DNA-binding protein